MAERPHPVWAHRLAVALCAATFVLILFGGLVTSTGAALAVPDWPTTFGYNMFLFPWSKMVGGILYEHSHRLLGAVVGLLTIALAATLWISERRRWLRWLGVTAVIAVSVQGVLGGLRVVLVEDAIAIVHGCLAQAFFGLTVCLALCTSREWAAPPVPAASGDALLIRRLAMLTTGVLYVQIVFGALLTHLGKRLDAHLLGAAALGLLVPALAVRLRKGRPGRPALLRPVQALVGLLLLQVLLGLGAYLVRFTGMPGLTPVAALAFPIAHRLTGALLFASSLVLTLRGYRLLAPPEPGAVRHFLSREVPA